MKELTDRLASIGASISEKDRVVILFESLPRSYSTLVDSLGSLGECVIKLCPVV